MKLADCIGRLSRAGVRFEPGLTSQEFAAIEQLYGIAFPPDLREFLSDSLPVSYGWIDWRHASPSEIHSRLNWPFEGICFDIENDSFWPRSWGQKPTILSDAFEIASQVINAAPRLIPIYSHRYIPDRPHESGNPVFSVYQTDIIYYGEDLFSYFCNEFPEQFVRPRFTIGEVKRIEFWSDLVDSCGNVE